MGETSVTARSAICYDMMGAIGRLLARKFKYDAVRGRGLRLWILRPSLLRSYLVKQARHVVFLHECAGAGQALRGELLSRDAGPKDLLGRAHAGNGATLLGRKRRDALRVVVVLVLSSDVLKFISR